ncbi:hypothetical protein Tco_1454230, partial [Tanacetum coccineum]
KYYKHKRNESEKSKLAEEPKEQHVSPVRSGKGKGYIHSGDQEANVPSAFKKNVVPRKTRSLTVAKQHCGRTSPVVEDPAVQSLLDLRKGSKASGLESLKQAKQAVRGEVSSAAHNKYFEFGDISSTDIYTDAHTTSMVANTEGNPEEMFPDEAAYHTSSPPANTTNYPITHHQQNSLQAKEKKLMQKAKKNMMKINFKRTLYDTIYDSIILDQEALNAQDAEPFFHKWSHDHQDPPTDHEGETRKKRQKDVGQSSSRSSKKDQTPIVYAQEDTTNEHQILGPSTVAIAKKLKELIQKDELTIAHLEGDGLEKLKNQYKNDVELECHVDQLKEVVLTEAHLTKHFAARYHIQGIKDMIHDKWSKEVHYYHIEALNGIHH